MHFWCVVSCAFLNWQRNVLPGEATRYACGLAVWRTTHSLLTEWLQIQYHVAVSSAHRQRRRVDGSVEGLRPQTRAPRSRRWYLVGCV